MEALYLIANGSKPPADHKELASNLDLAEKVQILNAPDTCQHVAW